MISIWLQISPRHWTMHAKTLHAGLCKIKHLDLQLFVTLQTVSSKGFNYLGHINSILTIFFLFLSFYICSVLSFFYFFINFHYCNVHYCVAIIFIIKQIICEIILWMYLESAQYIWIEWIYWKHFNGLFAAVIRSVVCPVTHTQYQNW